MKRKSGPGNASKGGEVSGRHGDLRTPMAGTIVKRGGGSSGGSGGKKR